MLQLVEFKSLDSQNLAVCQRLLNACQAELPATVVMADLMATGAQALLAHDEQVLKGLLVWLPSFDSAYLSLLLVEPTARQQRIGTGMLQSWLTLMKERGIHAVGLEVPVSQAAALALYQKCGFQEQERLAQYYPGQNGSGLDAYRMQKIL